MNRLSTVKDLLSWGKIYLRDKSIESYCLDAELLMCRASGLSRIELYTKDLSVLADSVVSVYCSYIEKRGNRMPVQYILNRCEFMGMDFYVDENVLIPRPDTECLVEAAISLINENGYKSVLDIGTGSGCIIISVLKYCEKAFGTGADISCPAVEIALKNALANGVGERSIFIVSDLFENISGRYDVIISNPPYIRTADISFLDGCVKNYEPQTALDGGENGLNYYEKIVSQLNRHLKPGGIVIFETGYDQSVDVKNILLKNDFIDIKIINDLAGYGRVVIGKRWI